MPGKRMLALAGSLLVIGCSDPGSVQTRIGFGLNPSDTEAATNLVRIEIEIHPPSSVCGPLQAWHRAVCGAAVCTPPPAPGTTATATLILERAGTRWTPVEVRLPDQGPWDILVRGVDAERRVFLHGCRTVSSRVPETVRLWRPWCGMPPVCEDVDPLCEEVLDCEQVVAQTDTAFPPCIVRGTGCTACVPGTSTPCGPPMDAGPNDHCHSQVCTAAGTPEACGGEATAGDVCDGDAVDEDCDGEAFGSEADVDCRTRRGDPLRPLGNRCDPGRSRCICDDGVDEPEECGDDQACCDVVGTGLHCVSIADDPMNCGACGRACLAGSSCVEGRCVLPDGGVPACSPDPAERCNGADDDCNGVVDDGAAIATCRPTGGADPALVDTCRGRAGCGCGEADPCAAISAGRAQRCCGGRCVVDTGSCDGA